MARLSYYTESQAYGRSGLKYDYTDMVLREKMKDMGVDYYIHFSPIPEEDREVRAILALSGVDSEHVEIEEGATTSQQIQEELEGEFDARGIGEEDSMVDLSQLSQDEIDWLRVYAKPHNLHEGDEVVAEYERVFGYSDLRSPVWRPCRIQVVKLR